MEQRRAGVCDVELGAQLRGDESVDDAAQQASVADQPFLVEFGGCGDQRGIDQISLGGAGEPLEATRCPSRDALDDEQVREELVVGLTGDPINAGGVVDRLVVNHAG